jgi:hypothetical protein
MTTDAPSDRPTPILPSGVDADRLAHRMTDATDTTAPDPIYGKYARLLSAAAGATMLLAGLLTVLLAPRVAGAPISLVSVGATVAAVAISWAFLTLPARMRRSLHGESTMTRETALALSWAVLGAVAWRPLLSAVGVDPALATMPMLAHIAAAGIAAVVGVGVDLARVYDPDFETPRFGN